MFVIDVSYPAVQCGMVATAAATILESLDRIPNDEDRTKVGIITVDSSIHFYNLQVCPFCSVFCGVLVFKKKSRIQKTKKSLG
jgi:anaerobic selenocysteine-containing dehydrogenase